MGQLCELFKIKTKTPACWPIFINLGGVVGLGIVASGGHTITHLPGLAICSTPFQKGENLGPKAGSTFSKNLFTSQRGRGAFSHPQPLPERKLPGPRALHILTRFLVSTDSETGPL